MSVTSAAASVDWTVVGGAIATLIVAIGATIKGLKKGKEKVEAGEHVAATVLGGAIMDNMSMRDLTEALRQNSECLRQNTAAITRATDLDLIQHLKLDHRDERDHP